MFDLDALLSEVTLLQAHELTVHMLVKEVGGTKLWRVIGCYYPNGFTPAVNLVHMVDENNYDYIHAYARDKVADDARWILVDSAGVW